MKIEKYKTNLERRKENLNVHLEKKLDLYYRYSSIMTDNMKEIALDEMDEISDQIEEINELLEILERGLHDGINHESD